MDEYASMVGKIVIGETVDAGEVAAIAFAAGKTQEAVEKDAAIVRERFANRHNFDEMTRTAAAGLYAKLRNLRRLLQCPDTDDLRHGLSGVSHSSIVQQIETVEATIRDPIAGYFHRDNS